MSASYTKAVNELNPVGAELAREEAGTISS